MAQIAIKRTVERIPGGMMIVPLFVGAAIHTLAPGAGKFFGSFTGALFSGALAILAVFYVCMGATISLESTPYILKKGGALFLSKIAAAAVIGAIFGRVWHEAPVAGGPLAGLCGRPTTSPGATASRGSRPPRRPGTRPRCLPSWPRRTPPTGRRPRAQPCWWRRASS